MKKLTIEHLAPYLPYGLRCKHESNRLFTGLTDYLLDSIRLLDEPCVKYEGYSAYVRLGGCKPILRLLSDLLAYPDNEIPQNWIGKLNSEMELNPDLELDTELDFLVDDIKYIRLPDILERYNWLLKHHFDVFDLISKGLAIDINTLTK